MFTRPAIISLMQLRAGLRVRMQLASAIPMCSLMHWTEWVWLTWVGRLRGGKQGRSSGGLEGDEAQVQLLFVGKYSIEFLGKHTSRASLFQMNVRQEREELGCNDFSPHDTHFGALLQLFNLWNSLAQLEHFSTPMQVSCMWPYSWHLMHLMGIRRSLQMFTKWSSTWICPVRSLLAVFRLRHATFNVAVVWLGDLFLLMFTPRCGYNWTGS